MYTIFSRLFFCIQVIVSAQAIELEPITVEKTSITQSNQGTDYIYDENTPAFSIEEILDYSSSIDLKKRSPFGIQQDLSLRGSIFEDTSISLEGIQISDPQTGHFSLELPLTSADLEQVQIYKNSQKINFKLKNPKSEGFLFKTSFGQHALWEQLMSLNFAAGQLNNRLSIEHKSSSGDRQDTDFEIYNFSFNSLLEDEIGELELLYGQTQRDFGAYNFYSASFRQEEEHINQRFLSLRGMLRRNYFDIESNVYFRRHSDKFLLNRHNPSFYTNYHTTYVYGMKNRVDFEKGFFGGFDIKREKITSTNLNRHSRVRGGFFLGVDEKRIGNFSYDFKGGLDYYKDWDYLDNIHLGLGYFVKDNLKLRFSFDRLWRAPSFTELYYVSPSNLGNQNLEVQRTNNFELGADFALKDFNLSLSGFLRDQSDTIDWVKNISSDPWEAKNVGSLQARGFDFYCKKRFQLKGLKEIGLGYTFLDLDKDNPYQFSKYVFDYNRHKVVSNFGFEFLGTILNTIINFSKPIDRRGYTTIDLKLQKKVSDFTLSLEGINIFNKSYQEKDQIQGIGRWYKISLAYSF